LLAALAALTLAGLLAGLLRLEPAAAAAVPKPALLVLSKSENALVLVDPATLAVAARVPTGTGPHEVAVSSDGKLAIVSNYGQQQPGSTLSVIDLEAGKELRRVDLGELRRPHGLAFAGGKLYFTAEGREATGGRALNDGGFPAFSARPGSAVARYDPATDKVEQVIKTDQVGTHMLVVTPDGGRLYTANIGSNSVSAIDLKVARDRPAITLIAVGNQPEGIAISPDGREVWVGQNGDGGISILDTATNKVKERVQVGGVPIRVRFTPDGKRVLVSEAQGGEVVVLDAATRKEVKRLSVGGTPVGILVSPDGRRAFVGTTAANRVAVLDLEKLTVGGGLTVAHPDGLGWVGAAPGGV
jgi:YVTN family beta-propeller protein